MKNLLSFTVLFLILITVSPAKAFDTMASSRSYRAHVIFQNSGPVKGTNRVRIDVTDKSGNTVANSLIGIEYLMPSLPGRKPMMSYRTTARALDGSYETSLDLTMSGEWKIIIRVAVPPKRAERMSFGIVVK
jgi:hypothetical protein